MFHQTVLVGHVGRDPEMRYTTSGSPVTNLSVAVNEFYGGEQHTIWYRVACWGKTAENVAQYVKKGQLVICVGRMTEPNVWKDRSGNYRANLEMTAFTVKFGPKAVVGEQGGAAEDSTAANDNGVRPPIQVGTDLQATSEEDVPDMFSEEDIPF